MAQAELQIKVVTQGMPGVEKLNSSVDKLQKTAGKVQGTMPKASNSIKAFGRASAIASGGVKALGAAIAKTLAPLALIAGAAATAGKAVNVAFERSAAEQKLRNFTGSAKEYSVALALATQTADKFGLSQTEALTGLADMNSRLRGLGFGLKEVSEIQQGFQAIVLQSGTSAEDAAGAFLQLSQALGSGRLQGDELRSILERMPTLAQTIAESMGKSTGEIKQLGAEGKLTSDIIQKALAEAAASSDGLGGKLSESQIAMKAFGRAADAAFAALGETLGPAVVAGINAITWATKSLSEVWEYLNAEVFPKVTAAVAPLQEALANAFEGVKMEDIANFINNVLIGAIQLVIAELGTLAERAAVVVNAFKALSDTPVFQFIGKSIGFVAEKLGLTNDRVGEFKTKQTETNNEIAKGVDLYSGMPKPINDAKAAQKELTASLKEAEGVAKSKLAILDQELQLGNARLAAEKAINNVLLEQAERKLSNAKSASEQIKAAKEIYDLTLKQAKIEYDSTLATIEGMVRKAQLQAEAVSLKYKELEAAVALAQAEGKANAAHQKALEAQKAAVQQAKQMLQTTIGVAKEQTRAADAVYKGAKLTAQAAFEQNKVWEATKGAANEAQRFAGNMGQAAAQAQKAAAAMGSGIGPGRQVMSGGVKISGSASIAGASQEAIQAAGGLDSLPMASSWQQSQRQFNEFAARVWSEQKLLDRAARDNSRMSNAMSNYSSSRNSASINPQVNIQTGPVTQMDGTNFVTTGDLQSATASAAQQGASMALQQLQNNPQVRRAVGVGR